MPLLKGLHFSCREGFWECTEAISGFICTSSMTTSSFIWKTLFGSYRDDKMCFLLSWCVVTTLPFGLAKKILILAYCKWSLMQIKFSLYWILLSFFIICLSYRRMNLAAIHVSMLLVLASLDFELPRTLCTWLRRNCILSIIVHLDRYRILKLSWHQLFNLCNGMN